MVPPIDRRLYIKSLQAIFKKNQQLRSIINQTKALSHAKALLDKGLPASLAKEAHIYHYEHARLTISVPNSTVLSQLRFYVPELLTLFHDKEEFKSLKKILLKVVPKQTAPKASVASTNRLSTDNRSMLQCTASELEEGPLKRALTKLVSHSS